MPARLAHVGDVGALVIAPAIVDLEGEPINITGAVTLEVLVELPSAGATWAATVHDGTAGELAHSTLASELSEAGLYRIQARVVLPDGRDLRGPVGTLRVEPALEGG